MTAAASSLSLEASFARRDELAAAFRSAEPFPHVVIPDFLTLSTASLSDFPTPEWPHWQHLSDGYQQGKRWCKESEAIGSPWRELIAELSAPPFLRFLEGVTGIDKLIPDPHLEGGGLHLSGPGGHLSPHTDFHVYPALELYRRLNVLVYLNPDWRKEDGGELVLQNVRGANVVTVAPAWGTCVIFRTDDRSVHGFETNGPEFWRRSIALYYYTSQPTRAFSGDHSTHWREREAPTGIPRLRLGAYQFLMAISRGFSMLAHLANPRFGTAALRERLTRRDGAN